jgi:anti-sigma B factor antagonist
MGSMFSVKIETVGRVAVCRIQGEVDSAAAPQLREAMVALAAFRSVVLDFSGVPFIDSAGLGALIAGARRIRDKGGAVVLCSARRAVDRLLHTVGMDTVLTMVASLPEAIAVLEGEAAPAVSA